MSGAYCVGYSTLFCSLSSQHFLMWKGNASPHKMLILPQWIFDIFHKH